MTSSSPATSQAVSGRRAGAAARPETRFDRRLAKILAHATDVFYDKGYEGASMRDLSRSSGMSLAGLYYYFESKEKLLYLIQKHTFTTIVDRKSTRLNSSHGYISYAVFCLKKKKQAQTGQRQISCH